MLGTVNEAGCQVKARRAVTFDGDTGLIRHWPDGLVPRESKAVVVKATQPAVQHDTQYWVGIGIMGVLLVTGLGLLITAAVRW